MFFELFFKFIAVVFLVLFLVKLFNPKIFPFIKKGFQTTLDFFGYTFKLLIKSSLYTIHLLFSRTVYVIGLDIVFALLLNIILTIIIYPHFDLNIWLTIFKNNLFNVYVLSFFIFTYLIGLYEYLKVKNNLSIKFTHFLKNKFFIKKDPDGHYTYDEKSNQYIFHDE